MRIGIYPGSFNPVHIGHLAIANYLAEYESFDEIWFLITPQNPLKKKEDLLDQDLRLELVQKAIEGYDKFKISMIEWNLPQPTYTVSTLQKLRMMHPEHSFELIIGSDNWATFHRWKDYQMILKNFKVGVYPRRGSDKFFTNHPNVVAYKNCPKIDISSSNIRKAICQGRDLRFYMPEGLYDIVVKSNQFQPIEREDCEDKIDEETNQ